MNMRQIIFLFLSGFLFTNCVSNKQLQVALAEERGINEANMGKLNSSLLLQQREIGILKDSIRLQQQWKKTYVSHLNEVLTQIWIMDMNEVTDKPLMLANNLLTNRFGSHV